MKKAVKAIFFLIIVYLFFIGFSYSHRGGLAQTRNTISGFYNIKKNTLDVVFVGSSGAFSAMLPMDAWKKFGFTSYNFCMNCMASDVMPYAVKELMKYQKPKAVVIDVFSFLAHHQMKTFPVEKQRYNTDCLRYSLNRFSLIHNTVPLTSEKLSFYFDILEYKKNKFNRQNLFSEYKVLNKGFSNLGWGIVTPSLPTDAEEPLPEEFETYLDNLLSVCKKQMEKFQNTEIMFICYPYGNMEMNDIPRLNYIQRRIKEAGFDFLNCEDFVSDFSFDYNKDFWNGAHFNIYGAEKITEVVGKIIKDKYHLEDRRNDLSYSEWNEDIEPWEKEVVFSKDAIDQLILKSEK